MDLKALAAQIAAVAQKVAPLVIPGATEAIAAGKAALELIDKFKSVAGMSSPELEAAREELEPRVLKHIEDTASSLE